MATFVVVMPELAAGPGDSSSVLTGSHPILSKFAECGDVAALRPLGNLETPEACYLGLNPAEGQMRPGPLMVSSLEADPPPRSTHFVVTVMGLEDDRLIQILEPPDQQEIGHLRSIFQRLNTKSLSLLGGEETEHALVWEGLGDLQTTPPNDALGKTVAEAVPKGDADRELRRLIDDSINILMDAEFNHVRRDAGRPQLSALWPWGHGLRYPVPNLPLRRGTPAIVQSESFRMSGLARLLGYRHGHRSRHRSGLNLNFESMWTEIQGELPVVLLVSAPDILRSKGQLEELEWFVNRFETGLMAPMWEYVRTLEAKGERSTVAVLAPSATRVGLSLRYQSNQSPDVELPFDERSLDEKRIALLNTHEVIDQLLSVSY